MSSTAVLESLGYDQSPNYLDMVKDAVPSSSQFSHVYRKAVKDCGLQGVYIINDNRQNVEDNRRNVEVPVVFYCKAANEEVSRHIHQRVWNQNVAPFVLVETPSTLRLYCGFRFSEEALNDRSRGILKASIAFNEVADSLRSLSANAIDSGSVWEDLGHEITTQTRVDWELLDNLSKLENELRVQGLNRAVSHALIGKFVYLKYLKDRKILSDGKLEEWHINPVDVFSRKATLKAFRDLNSRLDNWLNGAIFPFEIDAIHSSHLRLVAGVFSGDSPQGQLHLDFQPYDFSFIPIETLSVIYEQFLHSPEPGGTNRGKKEGAYYTPLPLVNYTLNELENRRPLKEGMKVLDPSCGSGAFLVQCYRALIEKKLAASNGPLRPTELRNLLVNHIYGVDRDGDACQVAEMSLILTLLDYIDTPDRKTTPSFKLPVLRDRNIFKADFFDPASKWTRASSNLSFDWLVGNPPWKKFSASGEDDKHVRKWVTRKPDKRPVGGKQIAEAFVWRSLPLLKQDAVAGLVLPAMSLFKSKSDGFRKKLFSEVRAWSVTNFANLRFFLFSGRSIHPAMTLFFSPGNGQEADAENNDRILTFAPFVVSQRANRSAGKGTKKGTWSIVVNGSELGEISRTEAATGNIEPWKLAMWGTFRDRKLLQRVKKRFPPLTDFINSHELEGPHEGFQLRDPDKSKEQDPDKPKEQLESMPELEGELKIDFNELKKRKRIFTFPDEAFSKIPASDANVRKGRGKLPMLVSRPPHIIVDAARRFAIYSDQFLAVPPVQIGIAGSEHTKDILKALSVYLSSDFVKYQQFFTASEWGIRSPRPLLKILKGLPVPLDDLSKKEIREWADLRDTLAHEGTGGKTVSKNLFGEMNERVIQLLGLGEQDRILIEDFVHWNMKLIDGQVPHDVTEAPDDKLILGYLYTLKAELNLFIGENAGVLHTVDALHDKKISAIIAIALTTGEDRAPSIIHADDEAKSSLAETRKKLIKEHSQWLYFARDLRVYSDNTIYMLKPMEQIQWTKRQAILDAGEVIGETIGQQNT
jgi:hypothetical protein